MVKPEIRCKWNINISSLLIGFLLAACLFLTLGADALTQTSSDSPGCYQACMASDLSLFVLDTQTGQVWRVGRTETYDYGTPWQRRSKRKAIMPTVE